MLLLAICFHRLYSAIVFIGVEQVFAKSMALFDHIVAVRSEVSEFSSGLVPRFCTMSCGDLVRNLRTESSSDVRIHFFTISGALALV